MKLFKNRLALSLTILVVLLSFASTVPAQGPSLDNLDGSSVTTGDGYVPGETVEVCFTHDSQSTDGEPTNQILLIFPGMLQQFCQVPSYTVTECDSEMLSCLTGGDVLLLVTEDPSIPPGCTWTFCIDVTADPGASGPQSVYWQLLGPEGGFAEDWLELESTYIELLSFTAGAKGDTVTLSWETAVEIDNAGFNLYRAAAEGGPYVQVNEQLIAATAGLGSGASYTFDDTPGAGTFFYKLEDVDLDGTLTEHGPVSAVVGEGGPTAVTLSGFSAGGGSGMALAAVLAMALVVGASVFTIGQRKRRDGLTMPNLESTNAPSGRPVYEEPTVITYQESEILEELGPAQAGGDYGSGMGP